MDTGRELSLTETNAAHCPFCNRDAVNENDVCQHLIADWGDGSDGDDGILSGPGDSRSGNAAIECLQALREALVRFARTAGIVDEAGYGLGLERQKELLAGFAPATEAPLAIDPMLDRLGDEGPIDHAVIRDCWDSIEWPFPQTNAILGGMTSSWCTFLWADNAAEAAAFIKARIESLTAEVEAETNRLSRSVRPA